jgi:hypothetical protein
MKSVVVFSMLCLSTLLCSAQKLTQDDFFLKRGLFDLQSGISLPVGDYALSNATLPAGYAKTGYNIKIGINYDIAPYLGLALQYHYMQNPFDSENLLYDLQGTSKDVQYNSYKSDPWKLQGILLGLYYPFKTTKTTVDVRLLGGLLSGVLPEAEQNATLIPLNNQVINLKQFETSASNLGFQAGFKIRYQLYKQLVLSTSIDYLQTKLNFDNIRVIDTNTNTSYRTDDYSQKFQVFNFCVGLGIQFD